MTLDCSKILVKHEQLCLLPSHKISAHLTSESERSRYFLEVTSNWDLNTKWLTTRSQKLQNPWDFGTHKIYVFYICSKFQPYWWWPQRDITFKRNWFQNWDWNFRCLDLSQYKSKWHEISLTHIFLYVYKITKLQTQKSLNEGDMTKKPDLTHSFQKLLTLTIQVQMTWNFSHTYIPIWSIRSQSYRPKKA